MHAETLPPYVAISSKAISQAEASQILEKYILNSESHPHLHPDALITPTGVTFSSHGGPTGGVVMHNLRRVAAGLRGEYLEPEATPEPEEQNEEGRSRKKGRKDADTANETGEDWQTMSEWEREEGLIEVGEVGERTHVVQEGGEAPEVGVEGEEDAAKKQTSDGKKVDKEERKKQKKQRAKQLRKEKEQAKEGKST
ncbi:hypothetical protein DM02DRAFT_67780 [Periconia macrospinosa]|uniref:Uncharacterized protein n=1 Tax=Periconia macrospinosa TaxID=97972 RepID=A0A2V1DKM3_9PLEO|nr:hypothetical protein DM02DRAFT_67780 [Periconia macrospinosa]